MVAAELIWGGIGCLVCSVCSIFCCLATQMDRRNRANGLPGAPCCAGGPPRQYQRDGMLQQKSEMEGIAIEQADRANRLEAYIQRQRTAAAENILNSQRPPAADAVPQPAPAAAANPTPAATAAPALPLANRMPAGRPVMLHLGNSQAMFRPMPPMMAPYQMNQSPYAGTPILFYP
jgi:hypothetical protein